MGAGRTSSTPPTSLSGRLGPNGGTRKIAAGLASALLLGTCLYLVGGAEVLSSLISVRPGWVALGLALSIPQLLLSAARWKSLADSLGDGLPLGQAWREYYRSFFLNQVLPFGMVGDALRIGRHSKHVADDSPVGPGRAFAGVALERAMGQGVLFVVALLTLPLWSRHASAFSRPGWDLGVPALVILALAGVTLLFLLRRQSQRAHALRKWASRLLEPRLLLVQCATSFGILITLVLQYFAAARALSLPIDALDLLLFALPTLGVSALPFVTAGWGSREAFGAALFASVGLGAAQGIALGLVFGGLQLVSALPGFVLVLAPARTWRRPTSAGISQEDSAEAAGVLFSMGHAGWVLCCAALSLGLRSALPLACGGGISLTYYLLRGRLDADQTRWSRANFVTLVRLALVVSLGLVSLPGGAAALLVLVILGLDGVDGWLARRYDQVSPLGARFDMETDALLVFLAGFVIYFSGHLGWFILIPGALRYLYVLAMATGAFQEAPPSRIGRAVFVVVAMALVLSLWPLEPLHRPLALFATALLIYSFARSVRWSTSL